MGTNPHISPEHLRAGRANERKYLCNQFYTLIDEAQATKTNFNSKQLQFKAFGSRKVLGSFGAGFLTSDGRGVLFSQ